jgi:ribonuclease HI
VSAAVTKPVLVELLRFIAANEELPRSLRRYSGYDRDTLGKLVDAAADRLEEAEKAREEAAPSGSKGVKVRKQTESSRAMRNAMGHRRLSSSGKLR